MLTVLAVLAEFGRELIRSHPAKGRARAKARGVKLGRRLKLTLHPLSRCRRGIDDRDRAKLQCFTLDNFEAEAFRF